MEDWNNLRVLLAVVASESLGEAANRLQVSAATVSRRLAALEEELGIVLVERGPGRFGVTEAARAMVDPLRHAEQFLADALLRGRSASEEGGVVRVAALPSIGADLICPHLPGLYATHPEIRIDLILDHRVVNLGRGDADVAIRSARPEQGNLVMRRVGTAPMRPYASRHLLERRGPDLMRLPWIAWPENLNIEEVRWFAAHVPQARVVLRVDALHAQARAAEAGVGAVLLSDPVARIYRDLVPVPGAPDGYHSTLWIASPEAVRHLPRVDTVWQFLLGLMEAA